MVKINVDQKKCIGCSLCTTLAPKSFIMNEVEDKAEAVNLPQDNETALKSAAEACPVQGITVTSE